MGLYEGIKDVAKVVQKADNVELYLQLLDLGSQALDLQNELIETKNQLKRLEADLQTEKRIIRHPDGLYITLEGDEIHYCSTCWGLNKKLIQLTDDDRCFECDRKWREANR